MSCLGKGCLLVTACGAAALLLGCIVTLALVPFVDPIAGPPLAGRVLEESVDQEATFVRFQVAEGFGTAQAGRDVRELIQRHQGVDRLIVTGMEWTDGRNQAAFVVTYEGRTLRGVDWDDVPDWGILDAADTLLARLAKYR